MGASNNECVASLALFRSFSFLAGALQTHLERQRQSELSSWSKLPQDQALVAHPLRLNGFEGTRYHAVGNPSLCSQGVDKMYLSAILRSTRDQLQPFVHPGK